MGVLSANDGYTVPIGQPAADGSGRWELLLLVRLEVVLHSESAQHRHPRRSEVRATHQGSKHPVCFLLFLENYSLQIWEIKGGGCGIKNCHFCQSYSLTSYGIMIASEMRIGTNSTISTRWSFARPSARSTVSPSPTCTTIWSTLYPFKFPGKFFYFDFLKLIFTLDPSVNGRTNRFC